MPKTLLLADDSLTIRRVVELTFADEDVIVATVGDGRRAMARIASLHPDIVLADAAMSAPDGYDVAAFVKGTPELAHIPVILLTAAFQPIDEARAKAAGCEAVLAKPFELTLLVARVKELLRASEAERRASATEVLPPAESGASAEASPEDASAGPGGAPAADHSLEDLFDAIDASCSRPAAGRLPVVDSRILTFLPPWDADSANGSPVSLDDYFDLVDEATRRSPQGPHAAAARAAAGPNGTRSASAGAGLEPVEDHAGLEAEVAPTLDGVAAVFLSLLESSIVPASPQHVERALRRLLGDPC